MMDDDEIDDVLAAPGATLAEGRGPVRRVRLANGDSVIVKQRDLGVWSATNLATERAALDRLADTSPAIGPRLLGARSGVLVLEDLGERTVERVLHADEPSAAEAALVALAEVTARLHATADLTLIVGGDATWTIGQHALRWNEMTALCAAHGLPSTAVATPDVEELLRALKSPGAAAAFVHGDLTPNNAMIVGDTTCRLIDFEGAAIQHIGNDLCMLRFPFAWYGRWATIPPSVQRSMEHAHRGASARSDAEIDAAIAIGCAAMAILRLQRLDRIADDEQPPAMKVRRRAQIVDTVDVAVAALTAVDALPDLARWLRSMGVAMQAAWVEASAPLWPYPAFAIP